MKKKNIMLKNKLSIGLALIWAFAFQACQPAAQSTGFSDNAKIVSLNGTISEILVDLGFEENIVGVDVASNYPASLQEKPKVGHSRQLSAEGILALAPDVVIATSEDIKPELAQQIRSTGVKLLLFDHHFSPNGTKELIRSMADSLDREKKGDSILVALQSDLEKVEAIEKKEPKPKVLFIYARGTGTMMVAGKNTQVEKMIELAGGVNAVDDFTEFKPLTAEALVAANPDVILLFDSGLSSLGGVDGLLEVQGIRQTNAGKNKKFVEMEGQFLTGFSQRLGKAVEELAKRIH
jgi:iron complex transport system substrate-binding protein